MKSITLTTFIGLAALLIAAVCRCSEAPSAGSETTSGVEIAVIETSIHGKTTPGATALLFDAEYTHDAPEKFSATVTADDTGGIIFANLPEGTYNLLVYSDNTKSSGALLSGIQIFQINSKTWSTETRIFSSLRTVTGTVSLQEQPLRYTPVFIPGSPFSTTTDSLGAFIFNDIPEGTYTIIIPPANTLHEYGDSLTVELNVTEDSPMNVSIEITK